MTLTVYTYLSIYTRADLQPPLPIVFLPVDVYPLQIEFSLLQDLIFFNRNVQESLVFDCNQNSKIKDFCIEMPASQPASGGIFGIPELYSMLFLSGVGCRDNKYVPV